MSTTVPAPVSQSNLCDLATSVVGAESPIAVSEIHGGGSTRRFFRLKNRERSVVVMVVPEQSHEIAKGQASERWPFLEVQELLSGAGIRVPRVFKEVCSKGMLVIEDLGDATLARFLLAYPEQRDTLYRAAIRDLARAQRALKAMPKHSIVARRAFDEELLFWEVQHFREWALEAQGIVLSAAQRAIFDAAASWLAREIARWPRCFVHRDYQSRNLMVVKDEHEQPTLAWIDFQDAMLGPRIYDLVALLTDSYQVFTQEFVGEQLDEYAALMELDASERQRLTFEFDLVTVQRKLKDAGRFVYFDRVNGNDAFLRFVKPTTSKARSALGRLRHIPELAELESLLSELVPDESDDAANR